jgi:hypothetical protein
VDNAIGMVDEYEANNLIDLGALIKAMERKKEEKGARILERVTRQRKYEPLGSRGPL